MKSFGISDPKEQAEVNQNIIDGLYAREREHRERRQYERKSIVGVTKLTLQRPGSPYVPQRSGRKTICIAADSKLRIAFLQSIKELISQAREVLLEWRKGNFLAEYPIGLYPPSLPKRAEAFGW